jgi:fatty-acyl-CoA synthase
MNGIATIADVEAREREPHELPASTYEVIARAAALNPDAPALSFFRTVDEHTNPLTFTYRELLAKITQTANFFHRIGAKKDTVIAVVLPNLPEMHFVLWGGEATGIVMPLNPLLDGPALGALIAAAGAEILVTVAGEPWHKLEPVLLGDARSVKHVVLLGGAHDVEVPRRVLVHDFASAIAQEPAAYLASGRRFSPDDPSSWFSTGGTTGLPKLAMRTHRNEVANAWSVAQLLGDALAAGTVVFCGLPLFHVNGVLVTGLLPFSRGAHVIIGTPQGYRGPRVVQRFWEIVERHRVNFFSGVPTVYAALLDVPIAGRDVSSLRFALCGAAPMPTEVFRTFEERTGIRILEGYGLTEGTCVSSVNPPLGERRVGCVGLRVPAQRMKTVIVDERGTYVRDARDGEVGLVVIAGPNVFGGYRDARQNDFLDCGDGERWLNTGDLGRRDTEGYFWLTGRKKELIIRGGHNIDPAVIEEALHRHPAVELAAAVGRPDARAGELPAAYVQLRAGARASEAELLDFLQHELTERAAVPKHVRVLDRLPLTSVGKLFKPALKRMETRDAIESALRDARISFRSVEVEDDPARGVVVHAAVSRADETAAREQLGRFALPFTISTGGTA